MRATIVLVLVMLLRCDGEMTSQQTSTVDADNTAPDREVFSSTFEMARLLRREMQFSKDLHEYAKELQAELDAVKSVIADVYPDGPLEVRGDAEQHVSHPLNGLGMLRRMGGALKGPSLEPLKRTFAQDTGVAKLSRLAEEMKSAAAFFPDANNYLVGLSGVALLQESYDLNITSMARGEIQVGSRVYPSEAPPPTWVDMMAMGEATFQQGWLDTTVTWMEEALAAAPRERDERTEATLSQLAGKLAQVRRTHDQMLEKRGPVSHRHRCHPLPFDQKLAKKKKYKKARKEGKKKTKKAYELIPLFGQVKEHTDLHDNFQLMCNAEGGGGGEGDHVLEERPKELDWPLRCYWHHRGEALLRLAPLKLEEKSRAPFVAILHDFLHENEISHLKDFAAGRLFRSRTGFTDNMQTSLTRTSKQTWLRERHFRDLPNADPEYNPKGFEPPPLPPDLMQYLEVLDPTAFALSLRLEAATGLRLRGPFSAESYQVANYGLGGQYSTHHDANGFYDGKVSAAKQPDHYRHLRSVGDRFVTIMGYLTDVEHGGTTVFPLIGVRSPVQRGALVLWFNLMTEGVRDQWGYHGGCPVTVGSKWITNKWVWYHDQFHAWPCSMDRGQRHDVLSRWRSKSSVRLPAKDDFVLPQRLTF